MLRATMCWLFLGVVLAGCDAYPHGPVASINDRYNEPIQDRGSTVVVRPVGARAMGGGAAIDFAVEGPRKEAMYVASVISKAVQTHAKAGGPQYLALTDVRGSVELGTPRDQWPAPSFACVLYGAPTWEALEQDGRSRFLFEVDVRSRSLKGPLQVHLAESELRSALQKPGSDYSRRAMPLDKRETAIPVAPPSSLVFESASVGVARQPLSYWEDYSGTYSPAMARTASDPAR